MIGEEARDSIAAYSLSYLEGWRGRWRRWRGCSPKPPPSWLPWVLLTKGGH
jgi:hypothetical protein